MDLDTLNFEETGTSAVRKRSVRRKSSRTSAIIASASEPVSKVKEGCTDKKIANRSHRSSAERIYLGNDSYYGRNNILEGDPDGYGRALRQLDRLEANRGIAIGRYGHNKSYVIPIYGEMPKNELPPLEKNKFSIVYIFENNSYRLPWQDVWNFIADMENISCGAIDGNKKDFCLEYNNSHTGAKALFRGYKSKGNSLEIGIEFSMELPSPQFYAYEIFPLAVRLTREFHIIIKLRGEDGKLHDIQSTCEDLLCVWKEKCALARKYYRELGKVTFKVNSANLDAVWEYQYLWDELHSINHNSDCLVLNVEYVRNKRSGEILRLCRWPEMAPVVFPPCDLVMLVDLPKPLRSGRILMASELFSEGKEWIKTEIFPIVHKVFTKVDKTSGLIERIRTMKAVTMRSFEPVNWSELDDT